MHWAERPFLLLDLALEEVIQSHLPLPLEDAPPQMAGGVIRVQFPVFALGKIIQVNLGSSKPPWLVLSELN